MANKTQKKKVVKSTKKKTNWGWTLLSVVIVIIAVIGAYIEWRNSQIDKYENYEGVLAIHIIDVGQGDAIFVQFPNGQNMLIDGGEGDKIAQKQLLDFLESVSVTAIDYMMLTHSDQDHVGGLAEVIYKYEIGTFFLPKLTREQITTNVYSKFLTAVEQEEGAEIVYSQKGKGIISELYSLIIITPTLDKYDMSFSSATNKNAISPIMMLTFGGFKMMFTGDANSKSEKWFVDEVTKETHYLSTYDVDVLKVGHHGSESSSTEEFLDIVCPEYAVISVGEINSYDHPHLELLARLNAYGLENTTYLTSEKGTIRIEVDNTFEPRFAFAK